jgi:hypothetical protein
VAGKAKVPAATKAANETRERRLHTGAGEKQENLILLAGEK